MFSHGYAVSCAVCTQAMIHSVDNVPSQQAVKLVVVGPSFVSEHTGGPNSLHERGHDSCLRAVLCYKRLFTKACIG